MAAHERAGLVTERLSLRPLQVDDAPHFARLLGDDHEALRMLSSLPDPCTDEAARAWIAGRDRQPGQLYAIERLTDGAFLGAIGLAGPRIAPELGYWIGRPYWNCGYATEAAHAVVVHARQIGVARIGAETLPDNPGSARVLAKLGFRRAGSIVVNATNGGGKQVIYRYLLDIVPAWRALLMRWRPFRRAAA
jgi:[ribosomal protein S5]-alanine N-acetyltransferase